MWVLGSQTLSRIHSPYLQPPSLGAADAPAVHVSMLLTAIPDADVGKESPPGHRCTPKMTLLPPPGVLSLPGVNSSEHPKKDSQPGLGRVVMPCKHFWQDQNRFWQVFYFCLSLTPCCSLCYIFNIFLFKMIGFFPKALLHFNWIMVIFLVSFAVLEQMALRHFGAFQLQTLLHSHSCLTIIF